MSLVPSSVLTAACAAPRDVDIITEPGVSEEGLVRIGLTAAGMQAAAGRGPAEGGPADEPAIFFVAKEPGIAMLVLRASGNAASELLGSLDKGARVEVRYLGPVEVGPGATAASWGRVLVEPAGPVLLVPPEPEP